jgi:hypothetical protein
MGFYHFSKPMRFRLKLIWISSPTSDPKTPIGCSSCYEPTSGACTALRIREMLFSFLVGIPVYLISTRIFFPLSNVRTTRFLTIACLVWKIINASFFEYVVSCMEYGPTFFFMTNETA